ncbi:MAG TPA: hypothetical protein VJ508_02000, partial [Saprospiraceae bacterium]|nr:hypothetical protein [Saprospiraceae bacterium]
MANLGCCHLTVTCPPGNGGFFQCPSSIPVADTTLVVVTDSCGPVHTTFMDSSTGTGCGTDTFRLTRVYTLTDGVSTTTCTQIFKARDTTAPTISCPPNVTVNCTASTAPGATGTATATDNCGGAPVVTFSDATVAGICPQEQTITRTWTATDACLNTATCSQTIVVDDNAPPSVTCPMNVTVQCASQVPPVSTSSVSATDDCGTSSISFVSDVTVSQSCTNRFTLVRTYRATDLCGNSATCTQTITVFDNTIPSITCPAGITVQCATLVPAPDPASVTTSDNCGGTPPVVTFVSDVTSNQSCVNRYTVTRTYQAVDACGNSATCTQVIVVNDNTPPSITCPAGVTLQCASQVPAPNTTSVTSSDNCGGAPTVSFVSDVTSNQTCANRYILTRTYRAMDECGNSSTCTQVITVFDNTGPVITCPPDMTIQCNASTDPANTGTATASDFCGSTPTIFYVDYMNTPPLTSPEMRWVFLPPGTMSGTCTSGTNCANNTICFGLQYTPGVTGTLSSYTTGFFVGCYNGNNPIVSNVSCVMNDNSGAFNNCAGTGTVLMNSSGNTGNVPVTQNVPIMIHQVCFLLGAGGSILLDEDEVTNLTTSVNLPGGGLVTEEPGFTNFLVNFNTYCLQTCPYPNTIYRKFVAVDNCGNESTCVQQITIIDNTPPSITCPPNVTFQCASQVPAPNTALVVASDNCTNMPTVTFVSDVTTSQTCINRYTVVRTYRATDACGNSATCTQSITVFDNTGPVLTCPPGVTVQCASLVPPPNPLLVTATDNCGGIPIISFLNDATANQTCVNRYTLTRTYQAIDICGNTGTCTQVIVVNDNTAPSIICPPGLTVQCASLVPAPNTALVIATDNCNGIPTITFVSDVTTNQTCANRYTLTRTYRATDECLNSATCTQVIIVNDNTPPSIICPAGVTVQCASQVPVPSTTSVIATDNCGIPVVTFVSDVTSNQTCTNRYNVTRTYQAMDACGNTATCTQVIVVFDNTVPSITCPAGITVQCASQVPAPDITTVIATDNCNGIPVVTFVSDVTIAQTCLNRYTLIRTYRATDECQNSAICTQVIVVNDNTAPTLTCPPGLTVQCASQVPAPNIALVTATDNCNGIPVITFVNDVTTNQTCLNRYTLTRTYRATDECQNSATCTQVIVVNDNTPPSITCPQGLTVQCAFLVPIPNIALVIATDNCNGIPIVTFVSDVTTNQTCTNRYTLTRTYRATDECLNSATCTQVIVVNDNTPPFILCPPGLTVQCASLVPVPNIALVIATDN